METNINIYLHDPDNGNATDPKDPGTTPDANNPTKNKGEQGKSALTVAKVAGVYVAKQGLQMATSRVGQVTRDSLRQQQVNAGFKVGAYTALIVANPLMGGLALAADLISSNADFNHIARQEQRGLSITNERSGNINRSR